eukprot:CAMPEP_0114612618 /NCGR_PEP_ID=MMETSP0168-20121206/4713_1 /TAXON_ID=95228 ORGANISM="Vannella sp., Strain DIVA3 517/6/12" /NCGR_SAMPLE_ID=MMETSP0168 /ASSEMBLY_ACC=CAM_ASM_000044 /LENGTH=209 /DNA_ID=CAMNT_0001823605 /DNA_START=32 /DNA_END=661 /DNA_ORIENTATION=+
MIHRATDLSIGTSHEKYAGTWDPNPPTQGVGAAVEGELVEIRNHNLEDGTKRHYRYMAIKIRVDLSRKRVFDASGKEADTQYKREKHQVTGFLNVCDVVQKDDPHALTLDQLAQVTGKRISGNIFEFWSPSSNIKPKEYRPGHRIRLKTLGDSYFVDTITNLTDAKHGNYHGEEVLDTWDSKIQTAKQQEEKEIPGPEVDSEVNDDEWD